MRFAGHLYLVGTALRGLSSLGRLQIFILVFNLVMTPTCINVYAEDVNRKLDWTTLAFSIEFFIFTVITIGYSLSVENEFSFYSLVFLETEAVCFITAGALFGVLSAQDPWVRALIIVWNWLSLVAFLSLQRVLRQNWGWHAYQVAGTNQKNIVEYKRYQQLAAAVFMDMYHMVFFVTAEEVLVKGRTWWQTMLSFIVGILTIVLSRPLILAVRRGRSDWASGIFIVHVVLLGFYLYFAILNSVADADGDYEVTDDGGNLPRSTQRHLVVSVEWLCVVVRCFFLATMLRVGAFGNSSALPSTLEHLFPSSSPDYLINDDQVSVARSRAQSSGLPHRDVKVYDATGRTTRSSVAASREGGDEPRNARRSQLRADVGRISEKTDEDDDVLSDRDDLDPAMLPSVRDLS